MSTEITIIKDVERLISSNEINQSDADKLIHNLDALLFSNNSDSKKFGVLLKAKIVSKLFYEVTELENKISTFGNSRSKQEERRKLIIKNDILSNLIITLFQNYSDYLSDSEEYRIFENNRIQRIETICQNLLNENINDNDPFPEYYDKSNADKIISEIEEYYKRLFQTPENTMFVKTKLLQLSQSIKLKVSDIESKISISKEKEDEYRKKILTFSNEQSEEKDRIFDLYDCEANEIMNMFQYKNDLINLYNHIVEEYPFINSKPMTISDITVFGDSNIEAIKRIYLEFSDFIDKTVTNESDFVQTFLDLPIADFKINLVNGSLPDYAYFIKELKPFFVKKIRESAGTYNQWWSDRFLFSGKEKNSKSISNMISGLDKGREASKKGATKNIISFLSSSYNRPT
ncbi:hypothetical protein [Epilithonimonas sp.]|uniref:hypothetical protein n=1 Tax=Epilithonimonas sp. TaxID=2894511 RepID=UPI0028A86C49|nr:hypothetical protein [Epilithonimonas sp.]